MAEICNELLRALENAVGSEYMAYGEAVGADYGHDELAGGVAHMPAAVVQAGSTEEVSAVLRLCSAAGVPVTPRGAGTGLAGGAVPLSGGVVLSLGRMNRVLGFDEDSLTLRVQPGVLLSELKAEAESRGLRYPPDPGEKTATIGGNVSTNAGGPSAVKYGVTRNYITGAVVVLPSGEVLTLGGAAGKNSSGIDLLQLIIGSEGTLGVVTELTVRLIPRAKCDVSLILPFMDADSCIRAASRIRREGFQPAALEFLDTDIVEFAGKASGNPVFPVEMDGERVGANLLLTLEGGSDDELDARMEALAELAEELECLDILVVDSPTLKREVWGAHEAFHTAVEGAAKSSDELNMAVPVGSMAAFVDYVKEQGAAEGLGVYAYGHAGDGGLHIYVCSDMGREEFTPVMEKLADLAYARCLELGGVVSSEHGVGYAKCKYLRESLGEAGYALLGRLKAAFDPGNILNPGKIFGD